MTPKTLLFATDMSCRCDRALDRAASLAAGWKARLLAMHVVQRRAQVNDQPSWRGPADLQAVRESLSSDFQGVRGVDLEVLVERGEPAARILEAAELRGCGLVVTGVAREATLARDLLGTTTDRLARKLKVPLLVVKSRPRGPYRNVVVATDYSEDSRAALRTALALFPAVRITLFHASSIPFAGLADDKTALREGLMRQALGDLRSFLGATPEASRRSIATVSEVGEVGEVLEDLVRARKVDLVIVGSKGGKGLSGALLGSIAQYLLRRLPVDTMVVRRSKA